MIFNYEVSLSPCDESFLDILKAGILSNREL